MGRVVRIRRASKLVRPKGAKIVIKVMRIFGFERLDVAKLLKESLGDKRD